ncbi:MFS transporter [Motilibacter sp. E257]|uniref:MFS transporter n=2 Tax=Motilibacter deserti TaxID=2714956 RepID=A0ABX0GQU1_9ACTN|nr:MFS transporter [Motilibacter deserti]
MGIGLVDPILPAISEELDATPSQVSLLFTSYLVVTAVAMLFVGAVSSRIGAKKTLIAGLAVIVVFAALAGASGSVDGIVGFRAGWGLGNALFIATSLAVIVASASGGFAGAIILYEAALGLGIAVGPLLGGLLGDVSWRGPFFGVSVLMLLALVATAVLVPTTPRPARPTSVLAPVKALRHRGLLTMGLAALCYNWGFFTLLGYAPYPMELDAHKLGLVFFGWGLLVALFSVVVAPRMQARFGTARSMYAVFTALAVVLAVIAADVESPRTVIIATVVSGAFIGINNTLMTQAVMEVSPVERPIASSSYGFLRFIGGGLAPYAAGKLADHWSLHVPFYVGAGAFLVAIGALATGHRLLEEAERGAEAPVAQPRPDVAPSLVQVGQGVGQGAGWADAAGPVVVALDDRPDAGAVLDAAVRIAKAVDRPLEVLHVHETAVVEDVATERETLEQARTTVSALLARLGEERVPARGFVLRSVGGHAAVGHTIAEHANRRAARAVAVGAPSHSGLGVLAEGSATATLSREAECTVVLVRPEPALTAGAPGVSRRTPATR